MLHLRDEEFDSGEFESIKENEMEEFSRGSELKIL